jgi:DNA invertase Pin-like site-specific DNA recombinase
MADLIGYRRVSTEAQALEGYGLDVQERNERTWADANGHTIIRWETDEQTGTDADRPAFIAALKALADGEADGILVPALDRLARTLEVQEALLGKAWSLGGRVFAADEGEILEDDPDDPIRRAIRQMRGVFSELDRALLLKRLRNGRAEKARQGGYIGGGVAYGRRVDDGEFVPDEAELAVIARVRELRGQGLSLRQIAAQMETDGVPAKNGARWYPRTVQRMLAG